MSLIDDIILELTDPSKTLMGPILKTKVLASRIENQEIMDWADRETNGYREESSVVPPYRFIRAVFRSTMEQGGIEFQEATLPLMIFDEQTVKRFFTPFLDDSVSALEGIANSGKEGVVKDYGPDICQFLSKRIRNNESGYFKVLTLRKIVIPQEYVQVLAAIRSKLLGFILKLEKDLPILRGSMEKLAPLLPDEQAQVTQLFQTTIFVTGDNNTVLAGSHNIKQ